jgi:NAD-dependent deacetylase sirtuin 4
MYQEFLTNPKRYRMYWARNYIGWPTFSTFQPNETHKTLANWEVQGKVSLNIPEKKFIFVRFLKVFWHVTQNVDSLLTKAGCELLSELHGCSARIVCVDCGYKDLTREQLQEIILNENPVWTAQSNTINPDADVYLTEEQLGDFKPPKCPRCSGRVKPDVTFFGDNVDRRLVAFIKEQLIKSDSILVAGSSLEVMSSYRFILAAQQFKIPIAIVNIGRTRGDHAAQLKISTRCGSVLPLIRINSLNRNK